MIGRIGPSKRQHLAFDIVKEVREAGHDLSLTIVGPAENIEYEQYIRDLATDQKWATISGKVSREELIHLLTTHRYGLHCHPNEHFGIAVAEMVAAGAIPFVHDSGGAPEIVDRHDALCYRDTDEAVDRADRVLGDSHRQQRVRDGLPNAEARFGRERFKRQIAALVADRLGERHGGREP
jgi:glycosyltransferase involved in cell wall biosynthesis